jgi:type II secretory pathway pseudopilin PulG
MKTKSAFTIVEALIIVSIITILSAIAAFAFTGVQKDARDSTRQGVITVISEALEKYYDKNGEYPSVAALVSDNGVTGEDVASKLEISADDLKMPKLPAGATNPLTSTNPPTNDNISYVASSDTNDTACQTDDAGGCDQFILRYNAESGQTIEVKGRRSSRP